MKCNTLFLLFINLILVYSKTTDECNSLVNFMKQNGFSLGEDCCKEKGITCTNNEITSIEITLDSGIINFEQFPEFNNLERLSIKGDVFQGSLPKKIFQLPVKILDVSNLNISQLPDEIDYNNNLEEIYLNNNKIERFPYQLKNIINLNLLNLDNNNITGSLTDKINDNNFVNLETLSIQNNNMVGELALPENVRVLNIKNNKFNSVNNYSGNYSLKEFIASGNEFYGEIFFQLLDQLYLKKLILDNNKNIDSIPDTISSFSQLISLNLANCNLKDIHNNVFELENLKYFDISNNPELNVTLVNFSGSKPVGICELTNINILCYQKNTCENKNVNGTLRECTINEVDSIKKKQEDVRTEGKSIIYYAAFYLTLQLLPTIIYLFAIGCFIPQDSNESSKNSDKKSSTPQKNSAEQSTPSFNGNEVGDPNLPTNPTN